MREQKKPNFVRNKKLVKTTSFLAVLLIAATLLLSASVTAIKITGNSTILNITAKPIYGSIRDLSPNVKAALKSTEESRDMWDVQFSFDVTAASGAAGNAGAEWDGNYFYTNRWASNLIHKYNPDGTLVGAYTITGVSGLRDLAFDGTYMWGGNGAGTLWKMDFNSWSLLATFTGSFQVRAIAYGDDVIYASGWADPVYKIDPNNGNIIGTFNLVSTISTYGFAYDSLTAGGPYLWVYDQGSGAGTPQYIHQWDLAAGAYTGLTHATTVEFPDPSGIAGGLFFTDSFESGYSTLGGLQQGVPDRLFCYEIAPTAPIAHDVALKSIDEPNSGSAAGSFTPKVQVKNNGENPESSVEVNMKIDHYGTESDIWTDGFESYIPGNWMFPSGWTIQTTNPTGTWYMYNSSLTYSASTYPRVQELLSDGNAQDESLISPIINCLGLSGVHVQFTKSFSVTSPDVSSFILYGSNDGGSTWPYTLVSYTATSSTSENINISAWAVGHNDVRFKFRYTSAADATLNGYLYFDNFWVGEYLATPWGPNGNIPPINWNIQNYPTNPTTWTQNFWHRYTSLMTSYDSMYYPARIYYVSPYEDVNCAIITPSIDCSALSTVNVYINGYLYDYTNTGNATIEYSINGGTSWNTGKQFTQSTSTIYFYEFDGYNNFNLPLAAGQPSVIIRFRYTHTAAEQGRYWYLGNVRVGSNRDNIIFYDSFQGKQVYSTNFKIWNPDNWGPWAWEKVNGVSASNQWLNVLTGTSPTCTPYEGLRMAEYNSYLATSGDTGRLYQINPVSIPSVGALKVGFWMYHSTTGSDSLQVQKNTGSGWVNVGSPIPVLGTLGWAYHYVDISPIPSQLKIGFLGISAYTQNIFIDGVRIYGTSVINEYTQTKYVSLAVGETKQVSFPNWAPAAWHNQENVNIIYPISAWVVLSGDENPGNDAKAKEITLNYPFFHDIAVMSINSPSRSTPAQTLPVGCTIKNIGQYQECCYQTDMEIGKKVYTITGYYNTFETGDGGFTQTGGQWEYGTPTSGPGAAYSGTKLWATKLAGNYVAGQAMLDTVPITVPAGGDLSFWHWYDFEASYDGYNVKISESPYTTWTLLTPIGGYTGTANTANPLNGQAIWTGHVQKFWEYETFDLPVSYEGKTVKFRFDMGADTSVFYPGTYIDDILVGEVEISMVTEYSDVQCTVVLDPGESADLEFDAWTPDDLALRQSGAVEYLAEAQQLLPGDTNPANDVLDLSFILDYWHDVKLKDITQPSLGRGPVIFSQEPYLPTESWSFYTTSVGGGYTCYDDFWDLTSPIGDIEFWGLCLIYNAGWTPGNPNTLPFELKFYEDNAGVPGPQVGSTIILPAKTPDNTGLTYSGYTMYHWAYEFDSVNLADGWISIQSTTAPDNAWLLWSGSPDGNLNALQGTTALLDSLAFNLSAGGPPQAEVDVWVPLNSNEPISGIVQDLGVFDYTDLNCYANIYEYYTDPENGTLVYSDSDSGIDLTPLGGEETVSFENYVFAVQGIYQLVLNIPLNAPDVDDYPNNNQMTLGIGCDNTKPTSTHSLDPAYPNGKNGWYVSDLTITLDANDGTEIWQSGVKEIAYKVGGGAIKTIPGGHGSFKIEDDGEDISVEYWAVDKVGNEETHHFIIGGIDMDQTKPTIALIYEVTGGNSIQGWEFTFTATATDDMSGMDYVEFYFNNILQTTVNGSGPTYEWTFQYNPIPKAYIKAIGYDIAGNNDFSEIVDPKPVSNEQTTPSGSTQTTKTVKINLGR